MKTIFDITEYGAVGDGKTDCTQAIQAALDDAAKCQGEVIVPPGTYLTGRLHMGEKTKLTGTAAWLFGQFGGSMFLLNDPDAECMIDISGAFGCSICGMNLNGNGLGRNVHGVYLYWAKYNGGGKEDTPTIDDCKIGNFTGDGIHYKHVWCFTLRHSQMYHNVGAGLYMDGWDAFIIDNWFSGNGKGGLVGGYSCTSITATGNRVEWNGYGGFIIGSGNSINITGNFFDRSFGPALVMGSCNGRKVYDVTVTGNIFRRSGKPDPSRGSYGKTCIITPYDSSHIKIHGLNNCTIVGNTFKYGRDDGAKGTYSPNYSVIAKDCDYVIIKDNAMQGGALVQNIIYDGNGHNIISDNLGNAQPAPIG